jgi:hypothetical protein
MPFFAPCSTPVQALFVEHFLPTVTGHAMRRFRRHPDREDKVAEAVAFAWQSYLRLVEAGKPCEHLVGAIAKASASKAKEGRRFAGVEKRKAKHADVYSRCTRNRGVTAEKQASLRSASAPDDVALRMDLAAFLPTLPERARRMMQALAGGERVVRLANAEGVTHSAVFEARLACQRRWREFQGE